MLKYDINTKTLEPQVVASIRQVVPSVDALGPFFLEIEEYLQAQSVESSGPGMIVFYDTEYSEGSFDAEAAIRVASELQGNERIKVYEIPAVDEGVHQAHQALGQWIADHGYQLAGTNRVIFLQCEDSEVWTVEIQYIVTKD